MKSLINISKDELLHTESSLTEKELLGGSLSTDQKESIAHMDTPYLQVSDEEFFDAKEEISDLKPGFSRPINRIKFIDIDTEDVLRSEGITSSAKSRQDTASKIAKTIEEAPKAVLSKIVGFIEEKIQNVHELEVLSEISSVQNKTSSMENTASSVQNKTSSISKESNSTTVQQIQSNTSSDISESRGSNASSSSKSPKSLDNTIDDISSTSYSAYTSSCTYQNNFMIYNRVKMDENPIFTRPVEVSRINERSRLAEVRTINDTLLNKKQFPSVEGIATDNPPIVNQPSKLADQPENQDLSGKENANSPEEEPMNDMTTQTEATRKKDNLTKLKDKQMISSSIVQDHQISYPPYATEKPLATPQRSDEASLLKNEIELSSTIKLNPEHRVDETVSEETASTPGNFSIYGTLTIASSTSTSSDFTTSSPLSDQGRHGSMPEPYCITKAG